MAIFAWGRELGTQGVGSTSEHHNLVDLVEIFIFSIGQNGRPGGREYPRSISLDETSRIKLV